MEILQKNELFELSNTPFCVVGREGNFKKANKAFQNITGLPEHLLFEKPLVEFLHEEDVALLTALFPSEANGEKAAPVARLRSANRSEKWFTWNLIAVGPTELYFCLKDVSVEKQLEKDLQNVLNANQRILDCSLDLICSLDMEGRFLTVSKASEKLLGYTDDEMKGRPCTDFLHPSDREITHQMALDLLAGAEMTNFENRYIHKNGSTIPIVWSAKFSNEDKLFYCVARNASERKKQEEQIKFNENRFRSLVQAGADLISILDQHGTYLYVSPTVSNVAGYDPEELRGKNMIDLVHPDSQETVKTALNTVLQQYRVELPVYRKLNSRGEWRYIKTTLTNLVNDPSINGIVENSRDFTEQIVVEGQKESAIRRLDNIIENYTQGYLSLDKDWVIKGVNPATLRLLGTTEDMLLDKSITELFPNHESAFYEQYRLAIRENRFVEFEERMLSTNRWFQISAYPYEDTLTVFFKEITHEKLQRLLVNLEKEVLELNTTTVSARSLFTTVEKYLTGLNEIYQVKCLLSLYSRQKSQLVPFCATTLPQGFVGAFLEGFPLTEEFGACAMAGITKQSYMIRDLLAHPAYQRFSKVLIEHQIRSCWSHPMLDAKGELVGTLAVYHKTIKEPDEEERELIRRASAFLQILIESQQVKEHLLISNEKYRLITHATNDATYDWNMEDDFLDWGEGVGKLFGYKERKNKLTDWEERIHPEERDRVNKSLSDALKNPKLSYWHEEYRYRRADGNYAFVIDDGYILRDEDELPIRMVGALKDITKLKENAIQITLQNTRLQEIATINSHHIRKPLANVLGLISALKTADSSQVSELLSMLDESGQELDNIVRMIAQKTLI